jgi:hypothetical protein
LMFSGIPNEPLDEVSASGLAFMCVSLKSIFFVISVLTRL